MIKIQNKSVISVNDWDDLVKETYGRPYNFQQRYGCQDRGRYDFTVPSDETHGDEMGVKFSSWLKRDPKQPITNQEVDYEFYPDFQTVANDLHAKGLISAGSYEIEIDW